MPCCCESNLKASFVMGIIFAVLDIVGLLVQRDLQSIITGLIFACGNLLLVYGAHKRHRDAILVWIVFAVIQALILIVYCGLLINALVIAGHLLGNPLYDATFTIIFIALIIYIIMVALLIWTMIVANRARKDILDLNVNKA